MKINSERTQLSTKNVIDDMDFWDWYVRRITREGRYRRDIVAQKSFSKLRSAIAGLYFSRGRITDAERAYNDARVLYPVSPEATFRYVQDILIRQRRYGEALEAIEYFSRMDPNNERGPYVAGIIRQMSENETRLANLLAKRKAGETPPVSDALETAEILLKMGNASMAAETMRPYVGAAGLSVGECFKMADILEEAGDVVQAARAMDRIWRKDLVRKSPEKLGLAVRIYQAAGVVDKLSELLPIHLALSPGDWQAWLTMAGLESMSGRMDSAVAAMENAISKGGDQVLPTIEKSSALQAVLERLMQKRRTRQTGSMGFQPGLPGMK